MDETVGIFLFTNKMKLLVCHPTNSSWQHWSVPKGLKEKGEDPFSAGIRELYEETNIDYKTHIEKKVIHILLNIDGFKYPKRNKVLYPYFIKLDYNDVSHFDLKCESMVNIDGREPFPEVDAYKWVDIDEAKKLLHITQINAIDYYLNELKTDAFCKKINNW